MNTAVNASKKAPPVNKPQEKKQKIETQYNDEKPDLAIIFAGTLDQAFELNNAANKKILRDKLKSFFPQWNLLVVFTHVKITNDEEVRTATALIPKIAEIQKTMIIGTLVILPGSDTDTSIFNQFLVELMKQVNPLTTIGVMTTCTDDLWQQTTEEITKYQAYKLNLYTMFMATCPRVNVISLSQPAEFKPKTPPKVFIDRLAGRIRPLVPSTKDLKTVTKIAETEAVNGVLDFGTAEDQQMYKNLKKKSKTKTVPAGTAMTLRQNSQL